MDFKSEKPIYQQIVDYVCDNIASGRSPEKERILSVRDLATLLQVNPNTVMRAFERLQVTGIIINSRGVGYSVSAGAKDRVIELKRTEFFDVTLPEVFARMKTLQISFSELEEAYTAQTKE